MSLFMRPIILQFFALAASFFLLLPFGTARGEEGGEGLSMVGKARLPPGFSHFDYANPNAPKGGTLRQSVVGTFDTVNPFSLKGKAAQGLHLVYDRLTVRSWDEPFTLYPLIAETIEVPEDRSSLTITIDKRARFQDRTRIQAEDVLFSFETLKQHGRPNMRQVYKLVDRAEKLGEGKVKFTLKKGYDRESVMILAMMPVLSKAWWQGRKFEETLLDPPISSGPYRLESVDPGRGIVLRRDPLYWARDLPVSRGLYNFDAVVFDYFRDNTIALEAFKTGNVDVRIEMNPALWATAYDFKGTRSGKVRQEVIPHGRVERMWGFIFNMRRAPFDDLRVRKAFSLVLDYDWINRNIFHGKYQILTSFFPNSDLAASSGVPSASELALLEPFRQSLPGDVFGPAWAPPPRDRPEEARAALKQADALLKAAGWDVRDGRRVNRRTGLPLRFEILLSSAEDEKLALALKRSLARLGVQVSLRTLDSAAFRDRLNGYQFDLTLYFWQNSLSPGTEQLVFWGCEAGKQDGRFNYAGICDPAVESFASRLPRAKTRTEMVALARSLDRVLTHQHYAIPLFYAGADFVASWESFRHPSRSSLYGNVMESWWKDKNGIEERP